MDPLKIRIPSFEPLLRRKAPKWHRIATALAVTVVSLAVLQLDRWDRGFTERVLREVGTRVAEWAERHGGGFKDGGGGGGGGGRSSAGGDREFHTRGR